MIKYYETLKKQEQNNMSNTHYHYLQTVVRDIPWKYLSIFYHYTMQ